MNTVEQYADRLPDNSIVILRALVGSTIHGTSVDNQDDRDEMAIMIEPKSHVIGLQHWETTVIRTQPEGVRSGPGDLDLVIHSLRKYCRLTAKGNPSMLLPLFVPMDGIVESTSLGVALLAERNLFISKSCGWSFMGYMHAQSARLAGETGGRHGKPRQELIDKFGFDTKYAGHVIRLGLQGIELMQTGKLTLPMRDADRQTVLDIRTGQMSLEQVLSIGKDLEGALRNAIDAAQMPEYADIERINKFLVLVYECAWTQL